MSTFNGLPAHILLVHSVVVLVPLTAVLLLLVAAWSAARERLSWLTAVLGVITLVLVPITTEAGEWLEHRVPSSPLIRAHTELGDSMLPWAAGLAVLAVAILVRQLAGHRTSRTAQTGGPGAASAITRLARPAQPGGTVLTGILAVLVLVVAVGSVVTVYRIGDSGAQATWTGKFSQQPISGPGHPGGQPESGEG